MEPIQVKKTHVPTIRGASGDYELKLEAFCDTVERESSVLPKAVSVSGKDAFVQTIKLKFTALADGEILRDTGQGDVRTFPLAESADKTIGYHLCVENGLRFTADILLEGVHPDQLLKIIEQVLAYDQALMGSLRLNTNRGMGLYGLSDEAARELGRTLQELNISQLPDLTEVTPLNGYGSMYYVRIDDNK